ncbi:MAG: phenylalanine--tRNA ligase subunit beta [Gammaproteobacteria bacterium]|nr:phenylalanine--tRNA ligase subunit beta [Gammaproteobacteria bacterium]MYC53388.1 phenylalanine--tRNA ligase subunit beta [Gammaproteobacteria bacterium]
MNVSRRWLRAVAPGLDLGAGEIAARLAMRGAPVEGITDLAAEIAGVVIGRVERVRRHPNADRLSVCEVDGGNGTVQVVCGAPNVRAGTCYPFVPVGAVLPGDLRIKRVRIRGQESRGMLCSARELGLGTDHRGILELAGQFDPGSPFAPTVGLDDHRLNVEVSPNRGDLLSHVGVARELVGEGGIRLAQLPGAVEHELTVRTGSPAVDGAGARVRIDDPRQCWRYMAAVVRGVRVGPSPEWLASRLRAAGAHPINNVVDATNYVLLELGQPLHAFDLARVAGPEIVVRGARQGETVRTLDGERRELDEGMLLICDPERALAIAGVMGGSESEIGEGTTDVLLECALFNPKGVRAVRRALGMSTDASYRFERGVDPAGLELAIRRTVSIIVATAGGESAPTLLDACPRPWRAPVVTLRPERVGQLLGVRFEAADIVKLLEPLGYGCRPAAGAIEVTVPGHRSYDTLREIDLVEEVARVHGYDRFPDSLGAFRPGAVPDDPLLRLHDRLRTILVGRGFLEAHTTAFAPAEEGEVEVLNPVSAEESHLRRTVLFGLLQAVEHNFARGAADIRIFDMGAVFGADGSGGLPRETNRLAVAMTGRRRPRHWSAGDRPWDEWELRGLAEELVAAVLPGECLVEPGTFDSTFFEEGCEFLLRAADGSVVGGAGKVRADRVDAPVWAGPVWGLELELGDGVRGRPDPVIRPLPAFPAVERDLALLIPESLPARQVLEFLERGGGRDLAGVSVFDLFRGGDVPDGSRSVGFRLRFQSERRTLTDKAVDRAVRRLIQRLKEEFGVEPRAGAADSGR